MTHMKMVSTILDMHNEERLRNFFNGANMDAQLKDEINKALAEATPKVTDALKHLGKETVVVVVPVVVIAHNQIHNTFKNE